MPSPELVHRADKRKLSQEQCTDAARIWRVRDEDGDEDEQRDMDKRRDVEATHVGGKLLEEDCVVYFKREAPNWPASPHHERRRDTPFGSSSPPWVIPKGPKASHRGPSRSYSPIDVRALLTPHNRRLSTREVQELTVLQNRVDNAIAGTGPSFRLLLHIPKTIQLNVQQKQRVYDAQKDLDFAILTSRKEGLGGSESVVKNVPSISTPQHDDRPWHDSDGCTILTLPSLHLADSIEGSLIARSMLMEVNSLLAQLKKERAKVSFSAADRETLRLDT
ncbi:hypothetical protein G6011_06488 [Alternaria panax]|uniref:Uncharacterized protein n=1 Tax=Alternaria panax TaxID=48097 RepID=A0AAD4FHS8_9PLEO|nr:hypothetical protein G6011_06488 [Alternaria panax]